MRRLSTLFFNLGKTSSASSIQFLIVLVTTPLMTQIYSPADYAAFGIVNGFSNLVVGIGFFSLTSVLVRENNEQHYRQLITFTVFQLLFLILLSLVGILALSCISALQRQLTVPISVAIFVPLLVTTYGLRQIVVSLAIREGKFSRISLMQIIEPSCSRGGSIVLGAMLGANPSYILLSVALGQCVATAILLKKWSLSILRPLRWPIDNLENLKDIWRRHKDFIVFNTASQQLHPAASLLYQNIIAVLCSASDSGHFILALSILVLPATLIALATAPVSYHHFITVANKHPSKLPVDFLILTGIYFVGAIIVYTPIYFFGAPLFQAVLGKVWQQSGSLASTMSIAQAMFFVYTGVQSMFMVTRRTKLQFILDICVTVPTIIFAGYAFHNMPFTTAINYLTLAWTARHALLLIACLWCAIRFSSIQKHGSQT